MKGDGTSAKGVVGFTSMNTKKGPSFFSFPLSNTNWHKVFAPWTEFFPRLRFVQKPSAMIFGLTSPGLGPRYYLLDRFHFYNDEVTEEISPTEAVELVENVSVDPWIRRADSLAPVLAKLENREQFSMMFLVEEEAVGRGLMNNVVKDTFIKDKNFVGLLGHRVQHKYQYHEGYIFLEQYLLALDAWAPIVASSLRRTRFETISLVFGGVQTDFINDHFAKIKSFGPDLIVVQHGRYDLLYGSPDAYRVALERVVAGIKDGVAWA